MHVTEPLVSRAAKLAMVGRRGARYQWLRDMHRSPRETGESYWTARGD